MPGSRAALLGETHESKFTITFGSRVDPGEKVTAINQAKELHGYDVPVDESGNLLAEYAIAQDENGQLHGDFLMYCCQARLVCMNTGGKVEDVIIYMKDESDRALLSSKGVWALQALEEKMKKMKSTPHSPPALAIKKKKQKKSPVVVPKPFSKDMDA